VVSELLVSRICARGQYRELVKDKKTKETKKIIIHRPTRNNSYNVFHGRRVAAGLHLIDQNGGRLEIELPPVDTVTMSGLGEPPSLFLSTNDGWTEFSDHLRKEGLTVGGKHYDLQNLPPTRLSDPYTMLSKFIFIDVQSEGDLGSMGGNEKVLSQICSAYDPHNATPCLFEPKGFYDSAQGETSEEFGAYASMTSTEMVSAEELLHRAEVAAEENTAHTTFVAVKGKHPPQQGPTREDLASRRDQENAFRYTEHAVPCGTEVTVMAKPVRNANGLLTLAPPDDAEDGQESSNPDAERFRFRMLKGFTAENLLKQRNLSMAQYYGMAVVGVVPPRMATATR